MAEAIQLVGVALTYAPHPGLKALGFILLIAGGVYGAEQQRKAAAQKQEDARNAYNDGLQERTITRVATDAPHVYVYGRARVGSAIVAMFTSGDKDHYRHLVCVHAMHECDAIEEVYIQGKALGTLDAFGNVTSGDYIVQTTEQSTAFDVNGGFAEPHTGAVFTLSNFPVPGSVRIFQQDNSRTGLLVITPVSVVGAVVTLDRDYGTVGAVYQYQNGLPRVRVQKHLGTPTDTADATLLAEVPGKWASTAVLRGLCYTVIRLDLNHAEFQSGLPSVEVLVRGKKLYDPRDASTTWSQNNALAIYDYLTSPLCGVPVSDLPAADFITAANVCSPITGCTWSQSGTTVTVTKTAHGLALNDVREMQILTPAAATISISIATPAVVSWAIHGLAANAPVVFNSTGKLPDGITTGTVYYVIATGLTANTFQFSLNVGGAPINTSGTQNGAHIATNTATPTAHYKITGVTANTFTYTAPASLVNSGTLTIGGQYTLNGTVSSAQQQGPTLEKMAQSMAGFLVGTTWGISAGKYIAPVVSLNQTDIVGALAVTPGLSDSVIYNGVRGQYSSAINQYVLTDFSPYQNASYVTADGREIWTNIDFPFTDQKQRVVNLCRTFIEDQRNCYTVRAAFSTKVWARQIGERISFTSPFLGQTSKVYRITDKKYAPDTSIELSLKEDISTIWDYSDAAATDAVPGTNLPNPYAIANLASLTCTSGTATVIIMNDGTIVPRILATWPLATTQAVVTNGFIEVEWQNYLTSVWEKLTISGSQIQTYLIPVSDGSYYTVRARTVNPYLNVKSDWTYADHQVLATVAIPANVTGFSAQQNGAVIAFKWAEIISNVLKGYDIGYAPQGTTDWARFVPLTEAAKGTEMTNAAVPPGTWVFGIRARDTINQLSALITTQNLVVTNPNLAIIKSVEGIGWNGTLVGLVEHYTGVLVPDSQNLVSFYTGGAYNGWEWVDQWVPNPVTYIEYTSPVLDASYNESLRIYQTNEFVLGIGQSGTPDMQEFINTWLTGAPDPAIYTPWTVGTRTMRYIKGRISATIVQGSLYTITDYTLNVDMAPIIVTPPSNITVGAGNTTVTNFPKQFPFAPFVNPQVISGGTSVTASNITTTGCIFHVWTGATETGGVLTYTAAG